MNRVEEFKQKLFDQGMEIIAAFCGTDKVYEWSDDAIDNFMDQVIDNMTNEEVMYFCEKYGIDMMEKHPQSLGSNLGSFNVDVTLQPDGKYDIWISHEGSSGAHYQNVTLDQSGRLLADEIDCVREGLCEENGREESEMELG